MEPVETRGRGRAAWRGWAVVLALALSCAAGTPARQGPSAVPTPLEPDRYVQPVAVASLAVWAAHLVAVTGDGHLGAWRRSDLTYDGALSDALAAVEVEAVATADGELLGLGDGWVLAWDAASQAWRRRFAVEATPEVVERLVAWPGGVALVYVDHVFEARRQRRFPVPALEDPEGLTSELDLEDALGEGTHLWLGDGQGEFGGHLLGLDLETGRWTQTFTAHPVVALAAERDGGLAVATALSHGLGQTSQLHRAGPAGGLTGSLTPVEGLALQRLARGPDGALWTVAQRHLARLDEAGRPRPMAQLGPLAPEPGSGARVLRMEVVDGRTWALLPALGPPVVVRDAVVVALASPPRPTPRFRPVFSRRSGPSALTTGGALLEVHCQAGADRRDRWEFSEADGGPGAADRCAFTSPGAAEALRLGPLRAGRWVFSDARGRRLEQLDVDAHGGALTVHRRWWGENGRLLVEDTRQYQPAYRRLGAERWYWRNGRLQGERAYHDGELEGPVSAWHVNGAQALAGAFHRGLREGPWTAWYADGQRRAEGAFSEGRLVGTLTEWSREGRPRRERSFRDGKPAAVREWGPDGGVSERTPVESDSMPPF